MKKKFCPTCRLCDKLNESMTHCAIFGPMSSENINSPAITVGCIKTGDYVRYISAITNEFNYQDESMEKLNTEWFVYTRNETVGETLLQNGMTLEEWAESTFRKDR